VAVIFCPAGLAKSKSLTACPRRGAFARVRVETVRDVEEI
jgi:hypothetical protein